MQSRRRRKRRIKSEGKKVNKKMLIVIFSVLFIVCICAGGGFIAYRSFTASDTVVPVSSVATIMGLGSGSGSQNRYAGVVESQKSWTAKKDSSRDIKKVYVKEGDKVEIGDKLFEYDESSMEEQLAQAKIELQQYDIDIADLQSQIKELENEKKTAAASDKLSYTIQIQSAQNDIKKNQYEKKQKQKEITEMEKNKGDTAVVSELAGVVTKVNSYTNSDGSEDEDIDMEDSQVMDSDSGDSLITITGIGNYRVKCKINEQNYSDISDGDSMLVHSRVDDTQVWSGTVSSVDEGESKSTDSEDEMFEMEDGTEDSDSMTSSTSYIFYVNLDNSDDLLLGQHVYVEADNGQSAAKEGVWLDEAYICDIDAEAYVWADNGKGKLEKRYIVLGEYDEELFQYEVLSGLTTDDLISYPDDTYEEGMKTEVEEYADGEDAEDLESDEFEMEMEEDFEDEELDGDYDSDYDSDLEGLDGGFESDLDGIEMDGEEGE